MADEWYNSTFGYLLGGGLCFGLGLFGLGAGIGLSEAGSSQKDKIKAGYIIQEANLLGSEIPEKFYIIDGKAAIIEVDGKPVVKGLESIVEKSNQ